MEKIEAFRKLELRLSVEEVRLKGKQLWPYLRIYFSDWLLFGKDRRVSQNTNTVILALRSMGYGFFNFFRSYDYLIFSSSNNRKPVDGKQVAKADLLGDPITSRSLYIELPFPGHFKRSEIPTRHIVSRILLYALEKSLSLFISVGSIANENLLEEFKKELDIDVDHRGLAKRFLAQHHIGCLLVSIYQPKQVWVETAYTMMGYVLAFKEKGIPVVEFQHGTISKNHYAYYINKPYDPAPFPDHLLTFGRGERSVFEDGNYYISQDCVHPIGNFYLEHMAGVTAAIPGLQALKDKYSLLVGVTGQDPLDDLLAPFVKAAAEQDAKIGYVYMPRYRNAADYTSYLLPENVHFLTDYNFYQLVGHMDYHCTINSTTALEAPSFGVRNILLNIGNRSRNYFGDLLTDERTTVFVNTPEELVNTLGQGERLNKGQIRAHNEQIIEPGFRPNLEKAVNSILQIQR